VVIFEETCAKPKYYTASGSYISLTVACYNLRSNGISPRSHSGDDRLRRERLVPECEPRAHRTR